MKFRLVLETTSKNVYPVVIKFNVAPSQHQGLVNFLKIALEEKNPVDFTVEKVKEGEHERSKVKGTFTLEAVGEESSQ